MSHAQTPGPTRSDAGLAVVRLGRPRHVQEIGLLLVIVLMGTVLTFGGGWQEVRGQQVNVFLRVENLVTNVATPMSWYAIMALGAMMVIISGGIDLSVGSIMACSALGAAAAVLRLPAEASGGAALATALGAGLGIGLICGLINGALVVCLRMHPFIVTIGTMYIFRGIALVTVPTKTLPAFSDRLPASLTDQGIGVKLHYGPSLGQFIQPVPMMVMVMCVLIGWVYLHHTVWGRQIFAVGGNEEAARFSGLPVGWVKLRVYALAGLTAGLAGVLSVGYYGSASTNTASGYELTVIAAAVVGGASLSGGRGSAWGAVLGALIIQLIDNGIFILPRIRLFSLTIELSREYAKIINGAAIVTAVAVDRFSEYLRHHRAKIRRRAGPGA